MAQHVTAHHLSRLACLYVRQSTLQQVFENTESTARQYALRERALALGWNEEHIVVIDQDLGHSGASTTDRLGFQRLVAEVGLGQVGLVLGLEVSRLARNSSDWHQLLEICALTRTLILDEEGLYDPATFNDRLLLGLKGTMSEAELFVLRARLQGGIFNKARRGALKLTLPIGFVYTETDVVVLDPDLQVQASIREVFHRFAHTGSAFTTVRHFRQQHLLFPRRLRRGAHRGELAWAEEENSPGQKLSIMMCCGSSIIQPMQAPMSMGVPTRRRWSMASSIFRTFPVPTGSSLCMTPMWGTFVGKTLREMRRNLL